MNCLSKQITCLLLLASASQAQTLIDLRTQSKGVDFTGAVFTKPFKSGSALPATCGTGEAFLNSGAPAGKNIYTCTAPNTWTLQSGSSLPDPTGNANAILSTDGVNPGWRAVSGDVTGAPQLLRVGGLQGRAVSSAAPGAGQVLLWNNAAQDWEPGTVSGGSGGSVGASNYATSFVNVTRLSILGTQHNFGTANLLVSCYDNTVSPYVYVEPDSVTIDPASYNVVVNFGQAQSGVCVVNGSGGSTPLGLGGDLGGTSARAIVTGLQSFAISSTAPTDAEVLTWSAAAQQWQGQPPQGGGGVSGSSTFNALSVSYQSATTLTIGSTCTTVLPCNVRFGSTVYSYTQSATVTVSGGSGSIYFYVASNGIVTASSSNVTVACSSGCVTFGQDGFPPNGIPLATWAVNNSVVDIAGGRDNRAFLSSKALGGGLGIVVLDSGTQSTIAVDAALVPGYLTSTAALAFPAIPNGACSSELTIGLSGANPGDSVAPGWPPSMPQGVLGMMRVSAPGIVAVRICNLSGGSVTPRADTFGATVVRSL